MSLLLEVLLIEKDYPTKMFRASVEIIEAYMREFQPIDICDDILVQSVLSRTNPKTVAVVKRRRPEFAKELAENLTRQILTLMEANDMHNGYPSERTKTGSAK